MSEEVSGGTDSTAASAIDSSGTASAESGAAQASASASDSTASPETAAIGQAAAAGSQGPIPFEVHKTALENARTKALNEWRAKHGWAESVDPVQYQQIQRWASAYNTDPIRWFTQTISDLRQQYPHLAPNLHSEAARILAGARGGQPQEADIEPDVPVMDANGQIVTKTYSAERMQQVVQRAVEKAIGTNVAPIQERLRQQDAEAKQRQFDQQLEVETKRVYDTLTKLPHYKENEAAIEAAFNEMPVNVPANEAAFLSYINVVIPKLSTTERKKVLDSLQTNAAGGTVNPGGAVAAQKPKFKSHAEALQYYAEHPAEAEAMAASRG